MERTTNGLPPIHPGEYIREALEDLGMTQTALAQALGVSAMRISHLVREEEQVEWDYRANQFVAQRRRLVGNIPLSSEPLAQAVSYTHLTLPTSDLV